jgi:hypothetical protein
VGECSSWFLVKLGSMVVRTLREVVETVSVVREVRVRMNL